jgi:hypothetical protein
LKQAGAVTFPACGRLLCIMRKILLMMLLAVTVSCQDDESPVPEPDPLPVPPETIALFSRSFFYTKDNASAMVNYPVSLVRASALKTGDGSLLINFDTDYPNGRDNAGVLIPVASVKPGYTGGYPILLSSTTESDAFYQYKVSSTASNKSLPGMAEGSLKITGYNPLHKTISGSLSFTVLSAVDPVSAPNVIRQTKITINCSFQDLGLK